MNYQKAQKTNPFVKRGEVNELAVKASTKQFDHGSLINNPNIINFS